MRREEEGEGEEEGRDCMSSEGSAEETDSLSDCLLWFQHTHFESLAAANSGGSSSGVFLLLFFTRGRRQSDTIKRWIPQESIRYFCHAADLICICPKAHSEGCEEREREREKEEGAEKGGSWGGNLYSSPPWEVCVAKHGRMIGRGPVILAGNFLFPSNYG